MRPEPVLFSMAEVSHSATKSYLTEASNVSPSLAKIMPNGHCIIYFEAVFLSLKIIMRKKHGELPLIYLSIKHKYISDQL